MRIMQLVRTAQEASTVFVLWAGRAIRALVFFFDNFVFLLLLKATCIVKDFYSFVPPE